MIKLFQKPEVTPAPPTTSHEQEADRAAEQVLHMGQPAQSQGFTGTATGAMRTPAGSASSTGEPLSDEARGFFEPRFGHNFSNVRIRADSSASESARDLSARAYTVGENINFGAGEYRPSTSEGRQLLAHELAHVVQQSGTSQRTHSHGLARSMSHASSHQPQRKLIASGETGGFVTIANSIIAVQARVEVSRSGEVSIVSTDVQGPPTRDATELLNVLRTAINDSNTTTIEFIRGSTSTRASDRNVIVGNYALGRIDLDDVAAFGSESSHSRGGTNAAGALVHEIFEQYRKQVHREGFPVAHAGALAVQERLSGARILNQSMRTLPSGVGEGTTTYQYPDGREVDVIATIDPTTGQITNVRRVTR